LLLLLPSLPAFCSRRLLFDCCFAIALAITFVFIGFLLLPAAKSAAAPTLHPPATVQFDCCFLIRLIGVFQSLCCCFRGYLAFSKFSPLSFVRFGFVRFGCLLFGRLLRANTQRSVSHSSFSKRWSFQTPPFQFFRWGVLIRNSLRIQIVFCFSNLNFVES
jgi:hypothetical protein